MPKERCPSCGKVTRGITKHLQFNPVCRAATGTGRYTLPHSNGAVYSPGFSDVASSNKTDAGQQPDEATDDDHQASNSGAKKSLFPDGFLEPSYDHLQLPDLPDDDDGASASGHEMPCQQESRFVPASRDFTTARILGNAQRWNQQSVWELDLQNPAPFLNQVVGQLQQDHKDEDLRCDRGILLSS